jgi:hypothetical protein
MTSIQWGEWTATRGFRERTGVLGEWGVGVSEYERGSYIINVVRNLANGDTIYNRTSVCVQESQLGAAACELIRETVNELYADSERFANLANREFAKMGALKEELKDCVFN